MNYKTHITTEFTKIFNHSPKATYFSPGRVNLIGEHIDYHGGLVFPAALSIGTYGAVGQRSDFELHLFSEGYTTSPVIFSLDDLNKRKDYSWANYVLGVFKILKDEGYNFKSGLNLYLASSMPNSGGLSSSSSLELLIIKILNDLFNLNIAKTKMALLGKKVENEYIGVKSGIMDQFVIIHGKKNHALLLNTGALTFEYIPVQLNDYALVIANTNKKRTLNESKYNERYDETMAALTLLQRHFKINYLTELTSKELPVIETLLDSLTFKRVRHIISEQERTIQSSKALINGDIKTFASLLNASHASLKNDYEVTGKELDTLVTLMLHEGAIGARMTGAGFGGCAIGIVKKDKVLNLMRKVSAEYQQTIGYPPTFFETAIADGTTII